MAAAVGDALVPGRVERRRRRPRRPPACRPAGGGRPGRRRSADRTGSAPGRGLRASSSMAREAPTSSWPRASRARATARGQSAGRQPARCASGATPSPDTSTRPRRGSTPRTARRVEVGGGHLDDPRCRRRSSATIHGAWRCRPGSPWPCRGRRGPSPTSRPGGSPAAEGGQDDTGATGRSSRPGRDADHGLSSAEELRWPCPADSNRATTRPRGGRRPGRRPSPARRGHGRAPRRLADAQARRRLASNSSRSSAVHQLAGSEVEQAAGDDVALDLRACRRRWWPPASRGTRAATGRCRGRRRRSPRGPGRRPPGRTPPVRPWPPAPCRWRSPGPRCSPAASRCWVARDRARRAASSWATSPTADGSRASAGDGLEQPLEPPVQVGGPVPQGGAPLEGEQVHGHRPALAFVAERAVDGHGDVVEEDLGELGGAVHGLDGPHRDARAVHVDEEGGDPPVGRLGRAGAGQQDAAVGVLGQAGPDLLAGDPPDVAVAGGPAGQGGQVAARSRARRSPGTTSRRPRSSRGTMVGGQLRARRSRSWWAPAPRSSSRCPAPPGRGR